MIQNGVFRASRTDDPNIIAMVVDTVRGRKIFANDDSIKRFIARQFKLSGRYVEIRIAASDKL